MDEMELRLFNGITRFTININYLVDQDFIIAVTMPNPDNIFYRDKHDLVYCMMPSTVMNTYRYVREQTASAELSIALTFIQVGKL